MENELKLSNADYKLLSIVWDSEPVSSPELCRLAESMLGWKRTTTYTVLKRLCDKGLLQNDKAVVTALVGREKVQKPKAVRCWSAASTGPCRNLLPHFWTAGRSAMRRPSRSNR